MLEHYPARKKLTPYSAIALKSIKVLAYPWFPPLPLFLRGSTAYCRATAVSDRVSRSLLFCVRIRTAFVMADSDQLTQTRLRLLAARLENLQHQLESCCDGDSHATETVL
jgi:hypothetical protein